MSDIQTKAVLLIRCSSRSCSLYSPCHKYISLLSCIECLYMSSCKWICCWNVAALLGGRMPYHVLRLQWHI